MQTDIKPTLKEAKATAKRLGYQLRKTDGEFEIYPTGNRDAAYFTDCIIDALQTARAESVRQFELAVRNVAHPRFTQEHRQALIQWHDSHTGEWREKLLTAWYTGNYGSRFACTDTASTLQQLRNTDGHEILSLFVTV